MNQILQKRVVPVAVIDKVEDAVPLATALLAAGLDVIEVTFRTAAAPDAIRAIAQAHGARLSVRRRAGGGSHFCLALPVGEPPPAKELP